MIKHATASTFVLHQHEGGWRLGMIWHPRLRRWTIPGGHVEPNENTIEAAYRETLEETGLIVDLCPPPWALAASPPAGWPDTHVWVSPPWWACETAVGPDSQTLADHRHVDHQFVGLVTDPTPTVSGEHQFTWFTADGIARAGMFEDSRLMAETLMTYLASAGMADL